MGVAGSFTRHCLNIFFCQSAGSFRLRQGRRRAVTTRGLALRRETGAGGLHASGAGESLGDRIRRPHQPRLRIHQQNVSQVRKPRPLPNRLTCCRSFPFCCGTQPTPRSSGFTSSAGGRAGERSPGLLGTLSCFLKFLDSNQVEEIGPLRSICFAQHEQRPPPPRPSIRL